jgi:hypothetical protein
MTEDAPAGTLALARRIEAAWGATSADSARAYGAANPGKPSDVETIGAAVATYFGIGSPLSQAQGFGLFGPATDVDLDRFDAFYAGRGASPAVEVATLADPGLLPALCRRGYRVAEQTHVLARLVGPAGRYEGRAGDVAVSRVGADPADRAAWLSCVLDGFFEGPGDAPPELTVALAIVTAAAGASGWLARVDGAPAAGGALIVHDGLALFACDGTVPARRGLGAQSALIRARLAAAARLDCDLAAVCTAPGTTSQRNYERAGFRLVYARTLMVRELAP